MMNMFCLRAAVVLLMVSQFSNGHSLLSQVMTTASSSKVTDLEMELKSLQDVSARPDLFDGLPDIDQENHQLSNEEDENSMDDFTTLTPTSITEEEETRVDEPTDKGPTEPTHLVETTKPTVSDESASSHKENSFHVVSKSLVSILDGNVPSTSSVIDSVSAELVKQDHALENDMSEELHMVKNGMTRDELLTDDLISATLVTTTFPEGTTRVDVKEHSHEEGDRSDEVEDGSEESDENSDSSSDVSFAPEDLLPAKVTHQPKTVTTAAIDTFTRNARKSPGNHLASSSSSSSPHRDEDLLELMVKVAEEPGGWQKVSQMLGKLDYETSSKLKSALQVKALKEKNHNKAMGIQPNNPYHMNVQKDKFKVHGNPKEFYQHLKPKTENDVNKQALIIQSSTPMREDAYHRGTVQHGILNPANQGDAKHAITGNFHTHLQHPRPLSPMHMLRLNLKNPSAIPPTPQSFKSVKVNPNRINHPSAKMADQNYDSPINAIAIDVPGTGKSNKQHVTKQEKPNKQAYIAVTVYKPTKNKFNKVDLKPKTNQNKDMRFQGDSLPLQKQSKTFAMEKPVTIISQKNQKHPKAKNGIKNELGAKSHLETDHKLTKSKLKNKYQAQGTRPKPLKHPGKWKPKPQQQTTDEMEAQLIALSMMEKKLKDHLVQKERLRQRLRMKHHNQHRVSRATTSYM